MKAFISVTVLSILICCANGNGSEGLNTVSDDAAKQPTPLVDSALHDSDLFHFFVVNQYDSILSHTNGIRLTREQRAWRAIAFSFNKMSDSAKRYIIDISSLGFDPAKKANCFSKVPHDSIVPIELFAQFSYIFHAYPEVTAQCIIVLPYRNRKFERHKLDIFELFEYILCYKSQPCGEGEPVQFHDYFLQMHEKYPRWGFPLYAIGLRYEELNYFESAVNAFKQCMKYNVIRNEARQKVVDCYKNYTGVKDTAYITDDRGWVYGKVSVKGFSGQSIQDSILKYESIK